MTVNCVYMKKSGFTLAEILVAGAIFLIVMGLVMGSLFGTFKSWRTVEDVSVKQQALRLMFYRVNRELSSLSSVNKFRGDRHEFVFFTALYPTLAEVGYGYSPEDKSIKRFFQESADFDLESFDSEDEVLSAVSSWEVSYCDSDGVWSDSWSETREKLPHAIKISYKLDEKGSVQENIVNIAVARK